MEWVGCGGVGVVEQKTLGNMRGANQFQEKESHIIHSSLLVAPSLFCRFALEGIRGGAASTGGLWPPPRWLRTPGPSCSTATRQPGPTLLLHTYLPLSLFFFTRDMKQGPIEWALKKCLVEWIFKRKSRPSCCRFQPY